jgi:hypothetical protein
MHATCPTHLSPDLGQNYNADVANNISLKTIVKLKYLGRLVIHKKYIHEENKGRLNLRNTCYFAVQNLSSSVCCQNIYRL